jgi:hypothetical protein
MLSYIDYIQMSIYITVCMSWLFWMWMLLESLIIELYTRKEKFGWVVLITTTYIVGALMYFFIRRPRRIAEVGE